MRRLRLRQSGGAASANARSWPRAVAALALAACAGCFYTLPGPPEQDVSSFAVTVEGLYASSGATRAPLPVVAPCASRYDGGQLGVPAEIRGTPDCRYAIPRGEVQLDVTARALDSSGQPAAGFARPVAFRVLPGDLTGGYDSRQAPSDGGVATVTLRATHLYSEVRVWAEDAPPQALYADGGTLPPPLDAGDGTVTYAAGTSPILYFEEPGLAVVQYPDGYDNRSSPFVGEFLTIGRLPESGELLLESCADDPSHDGQPAMMVVTGVDNSGFFVTDLNACRMREDTSSAAGVRVPEPDGFYPGTFASMYVYNYSYPEGLYPGDLLWTLAGSVQEFTSTTQFTFPSWSVRESVRLLPGDQWDKYLRQVPIPDLSVRLCGLDQAPFVTDTLCGHNRRVLKMESLESALVRLRNVKLPDVFTNCDLNADNEVPFFCEGKPDGVNWGWGICGPPVEDDPELAERTCNINCTTAQGEFAGHVCSERSTYENFGQFVVEMAGPGPAAAGLDPSLSGRLRQVVSGSTSVRTSALTALAEVRVYCTGPVRYRFGDGTVTAGAADPLLQAGTLLEHRLGDGETHLAVLAYGGTPGICTVAENSHTRINLTLRDAIPGLDVDCSTTDPDQDAAQQCVLLRSARYDVVGHLRHVQPARPRWMVLPRDADDVCCHPRPGMTCPRLIKQCQ